LGSERNFVSIFIAARRSRVGRDPRDISGLGLVSMLTSSSGLILSGKAISRGRTFLFLCLYSVPSCHCIFLGDLSKSVGTIFDYYHT
jgi:hypothetical protein